MEHLVGDGNRKDSPPENSIDGNNNPRDERRHRTARLSALPAAFHCILTTILPPFLPLYRWGNRGSERRRRWPTSTEDSEPAWNDSKGHWILGLRWACLPRATNTRSQIPEPAALAGQLVPQGTPAATAHRSAGWRARAELASKAPANACLLVVGWLPPQLGALPPHSAGQPASTLQPAVTLVPPRGSHGALQ